MWISAMRREVKDDMAQAEKWRTDAMGTRKANEAKKNQGPAASRWTPTAI